MLTVVTWLWHDRGRDFRASHVNTLANMVRRHLQLEHEFVCITDEDRVPFSSKVKVVRTPPGAERLLKSKSPEGPSFPSCYRRLWMFSRDAAELGTRFLLLDIDLVITDDITRLLDRPEPFVGWIPGESAWHGANRYGGGLYLLTAGAHPEVYDDFNGDESIATARAAGYRGSDQAWLNHKLYGHTAHVTKADGLYCLRDLRKTGFRLPKDAKIVQFSGTHKPWHFACKINWIREHYR